MYTWSPNLSPSAKKKQVEKSQPILKFKLYHQCVLNCNPFLPQVAQHKGYVKVNWTQVQRAMTKAKAQARIDELKLRKASVTSKVRVSRLIVSLAAWHHLVNVASIVSPFLITNTICFDITSFFHFLMRKY